MSRREALATIAIGILDDLLANGRYEDAIAVADVLIETNPADAYSLTKKGTAYYRILRRDIIEKYPNEGDIPADRVAYPPRFCMRAREAIRSGVGQKHWRPFSSDG